MVCLKKTKGKEEGKEGKQTKKRGRCNTKEGRKRVLATAFQKKNQKNLIKLDMQKTVFN